MTSVQKETLLRAIRTKEGCVFPTDYPKEKALASNTYACLIRDGFIEPAPDHKMVVTAKARKALGI